VVKIFEVLEENYGVDFVFDEKLLFECALTTSFTDEGLYERIEVICRAIGAQYEIENAAIVIKSNGCK
jgi:transmembrane sensor